MDDGKLRRRKNHFLFIYITLDARGGLEPWYKKEGFIEMENIKSQEGYTTAMCYNCLQYDKIEPCFGEHIE